MAGWTTPRDWVAGEIVTASIMNTHVRDNERYLKGLDGTITLSDGLSLGANELTINALETVGADGIVNKEQMEDHTHLNAANCGVLQKIVVIKVLTETAALTTGDGKAYFTIPSSLNGMDLTDADAAIYTVSSSGLPTIQIHNLTQTADMLTTGITIDASEFNSWTALTPPVIDTTNDDVATGDRIRIDVDAAGTGTTGLDIILIFTLP